MWQEVLDRYDDLKDADQYSDVFVKRCQNRLSAALSLVRSQLREELPDVYDRARAFSYFSARNIDRLVMPLLEDQLISVESEMVEVAETVYGVILRTGVTLEVTFTDHNTGYVEVRKWRGAHSSGDLSALTAAGTKCFKNYLAHLFGLISPDSGSCAIKPSEPITVDDDVSSLDDLRTRVMGLDIEALDDTRACMARKLDTLGVHELSYVLDKDMSDEKLERAIIQQGIT